MMCAPRMFLILAAFVVIVSDDAMGQTICLDNPAPITGVQLPGGAIPGGTTLTLSNCGPAVPVGFQVSSDVEFIDVFPPAGVIDPGSSMQVQVSFLPTSLEDGTHFGTLTFSNLSNPADFVTLPVALSVNVPLGVLKTSADPLAFTMDEGEPIGPQHEQILRVSGGKKPQGAELFFVVSEEPPVEWLALEPIAGTLGSALSGFPSFVEVVVSPTASASALPVGTHSTALRVQNKADAEDFELVDVTLEVREPVAVLAQADPTFKEVRVHHKVGDPNPGDLMVIVIENLGSPMSMLQFEATPIPTVPWFQIDNGNGELPASITGASGQPLVLSFDPSGLPEGLHESTLHVTNQQNTQEFFDVPISFVVGPEADIFPGDIIQGSFTGPGLFQEVTFEGLKGMRFTAEGSSDTSQKLRLSLFDPQGTVLASNTMKLKAGGSALGQTVKLTESGTHRLRIEPLGMSFGPFRIETSRKGPALASEKKSVVTASNGQALLKFFALPGATLDLEATPKGKSFTGQLAAIQAIAPDGSLVDFSPFITVLPEGAVAIEAAPLDQAGKWQLLITGFDPLVPGQKAKVHITPTQPTGEALVVSGNTAVPTAL